MQIFKLSLTIMVFMSMTLNIHASDSEPAVAIELVARFDVDTPPGNIAIGPDGRIFLSVHEFYSKPLRIVELLKNGTTKPYPNENWAYAAQERQSGGLYGVLGLNVDNNGILWMLDVSGKEQAGRLVAWDTKKKPYIELSI